MKSLSAIAPILGATGLSIALAALAHADVDPVTTDDLLSGSTHAIFLGGTFEPTPSADFVDAATSLYLNPLGFSGASTICDMVATSPCDAALQVLTTPDLLEEGPSSLQGDAIVVSALEAEFQAGEFSAADPMTVFAYSQSALAISAAENALYYQDGIPTEDLRIVFIGDPSDANGVAPHIYDDLVQLFGGDAKATTFTNELLDFTGENQFIPGGPLAGYTPNDLYPTTVYTIDTDGVADWQEDWDNALAVHDGNAFAALGSALYHFFTTHVEYLGLTPSEIATGVATSDGLTTTITIPDPPDPGAMINDATALIDSFGHGIANSGLFNALIESVLDIFNPAYA